MATFGHFAKPTARRLYKLINLFNAKNGSRKQLEPILKIGKNRHYAKATASAKWSV